MAFWQAASKGRVWDEFMISSYFRRFSLNQSIITFTLERFLRSSCSAFPFFADEKKKSVHRGSFKPTLSIPLVLPTGQMPGRKYVLLILLLLHVSIDCACQAILRNGEGQEILSMLKTFLRHILYYQHPTTLHFNQELVAYVPVTQNTSPVCNFKTVPKHNSDEFILITF